MAARAPRPHLHGNQTERMEIMAGTKEGGAKTVITIKSKYGKQFYSQIGAMGGKAGRTGGFFANRELARIAGAKGGRSRRKED